MRAANILATIGNTPHVRINRLFGVSSNVWVKFERTVGRYLSIEGFLPAE